jgi:hypothetical protein
MSVGSAIMEPITKGKTMCAVCYGNAHGLTAYSVIPNNLCVIHYQEWAAEKTYNDLEGTHDYFELV